MNSNLTFITNAVKENFQLMWLINDDSKKYEFSLP